MSHASPFSELFSWLLDPPDGVGSAPPCSDHLTDDARLLTGDLTLPAGWLHFEALAIREHHDIHGNSTRAVQAYLRAQRALGVEVAPLARRLEDIAEGYRRLATAASASDGPDTR